MKRENKNLTEKLNNLLADYQMYYQNLRALHWNVKGPMFFMLHSKFEEYYNEAAETIDEIAERILMLGDTPLHTLAEYVEKSSLQPVNNVSDGREGVKIVLDNSKYLLASFKEILRIGAENEDEGTSALMSDLTGNTEKRIWMLEAWLA